MIDVMRRIIIRTLFAALMLLCWQRAWGFAFLGPFFGPDATWQVPAIGYDLAAYENISLPGAPTWLGDIGGPKNISEPYRRNCTVLYYAYDNTFQRYFGAQGIANADQAFAMMSSVFTAHTNGVDGYSTNLSEFPFNSEQFNGTAQGLYLTDLKSVILHLLVEQLGLAEPERYTWTLFERFLPPGGKCPVNEEYLLGQRNYNSVDQPLTGPQSGTIYSPYVNNILYTYGIVDVCSPATVQGWFAITLPFSTDPTIPEYTAVAANNYEGLGNDEGLGGTGGLQVGGYYTGLTEDDVAGLRWLMSSNTIDYELPTAGSELEVTNTSPQPLYTLPLGPLLQFAATNPPTALLVAFPNLVIDNVSTNYTLATNPVVVSYFTNIIGQDADSLPIFVVATNGYTYSFQTNYVYTFANMVIFNYSSNTPAQLQTVSLYAPYGYSPGTVFTNITYQNIILPTASGQYYLVPTNSCGYDIVITNALNVFAGTFTNSTIATATNTGTVDTGFVGSESIVENLTNSLLQFLECNFETNGPAYYRGVQHIQFVRVDDMDPTTFQFPVPMTNTYSMVMVSNGVSFVQTFQRIVTTPDILLTAFPNIAANTFDGTVTRTTPTFETGAVPPGANGPGTIDGQVNFDFNDIGTAWWNGPFPDGNSIISGPQSPVNQTTGVPAQQWGSFDGTTNTPIVYPTGASIQELEAQMVIAISPSTLPNATNGDFYSVQFSATGGTPSTSGTYIWSGTNFPTGLYFNGGVLYGTPQTNGTFDLTIQVTDYSNPAKTVTLPYTLTIY
jgi:hypothetical protein